MSREGWKTYRLGDFLLFNPRESIPKGAIVKKVAMEKVQPFTRMISGYEESSFAGGSKFRNGDTLLARITPCLENGKTAQVTILNKNEVGFGSTEFIVLREREGISDNNFIYYFTNTAWFRDTAIHSMVGSSGRQRVQQDVLENIEVVLPELNDQKSIAKILSSLDDKIELNNQINTNLEQQAQAIFKSWFINFELFKEGEFVESSELGLIPKGWKVGKLSDIGDIVGGSTPSKSNESYYTFKGIPWITPKDLSNNKNKFIAKGEIDITREGLKNSSAKLMPKGSILYSSRAPIGYIALAKNEVCTNQGFKSIVPSQKIGTAFIYYYLKEKTIDIELKASGSTFKEVSGTFMRNYPVIIPDAMTLTQFNSICSSFFSQQEKNEEENHQLSKLRDFLLPKLMSGEIAI